MYLAILIAFFAVGVIQQSDARSVSFSLNLKLSVKTEQSNSLPWVDAIRSCIKETQTSMAELKRFVGSSWIRDSDFSPSNDTKDVKGADFETIDESLHCLTHCIYSKVGLIRNDEIIQHEYLEKLYKTFEQEKQPIYECMNMESSNKCETAYKLHLCLTKLEKMENERRFRDSLDRNDTANQDEYDDSDDDTRDDTNDNTTETSDFDAADPKENAFGNSP